MISAEELLAQLNVEKSAEEQAWIILQFSLDRQPENIRDAVYAGAVPHWHDRAMLEYIMDAQLTDDEYSSFLQLPYVEQIDENSWNIHEKSRLVLLRHAVRHQNRQFAMYSLRARAWFWHHFGNAPIGKIEELYLGMLFRDSLAQEDAISYGRQLQERGQYNDMEMLAQRIAEIIEVDADARQRLSAAWCKYFVAVLKVRRNRIEEAEADARCVLEMVPLGTLLRAECASLLGDIYLIRTRPADAGGFFREGINLFTTLKEERGEANCLVGLGMAHILEREYQDAIQELRSAQAIYHKLGNARGEVLARRNIGIALISLGDVDAGQLELLEAWGLTLKLKMKDHYPQAWRSAQTTVGLSRDSLASRVAELGQKQRMSSS